MQQRRQLRTCQLFACFHMKQGWARTWCGATMFGNVRSIQVKKLSILTWACFRSFSSCFDLGSKASGEGPAPQHNLCWKIAAVYSASSPCHHSSEPPTQVHIHPDMGSQHAALCQQLVDLLKGQCCGCAHSPARTAPWTRMGTREGIRAVTVREYKLMRNITAEQQLALSDPLQRGMTVLRMSANIA